MQEPKESAPAPAALDDRRLGIGSPEALQALCDAAEVASGTSQPQGNSSAGNSSPGHSQGGSGGGRSLKRPVRPIGAEHSKRSKLGPGPRDPAVDGLEAGPPGDSAGAPPSGFRHYPPGQRAVEPQSGESVAVGQRGFSEPSQASGGSAGPPLPSHADPRGQPMPMRTSRSSQELASDPEHEPWTGRRPPSGGGGGDAAAAAAEHRTAAPSQQSTRGGEHPLEAGARLDAQRTSQRPPPPERPQRAESPGIEPPAQRTDPRSQAQRPGPSAERPVYRPPPRAEYRLDPRDPQLEQALEGRPLPPSGRRPPSRPHPSGPGGSGQQQLHSRRPPAHPRDPRNSQQGDGLPPGYGGMRPFSGGQREGYSGGQGYAPPMRRHPPQGLPPQGLPQQGLPPNRPLPGGDGAGQAGSWGNRGPSRNVPVMNDYLIPSSRCAYNRKLLCRTLQSFVQLQGFSVWEAVLFGVVGRALQCTIVNKH